MLFPVNFKSLQKTAQQIPLILASNSSTIGNLSESSQITHVLWLYKIGIKIEISIYESITGFHKPTTTIIYLTVHPKRCS